jgi:hypothetical protein
MHDAMIKILELFIKLKNIFNTHRTIKQVETTKGKIKGTENILDMLQY